MTAIDGYFDNLHFTECVFGLARTENDRLIVPVRRLVALAPHPLAEQGKEFFDGELIFEGVAGSEKTITEYIGDKFKPDGFKPSRWILDIPCQDHSGERFVFEGFDEKLNAWINEWIVHAKSFSLHVR